MKTKSLIFVLFQWKRLIFLFDKYSIILLERKYNLGLHDHKNESEFDTYFEYTNLHPEEWEYILKEAKSINNSVEIIKELENLKRKIAILTKIHTLQEMKIKTEVLRNDIKIKPIVPPKRSIKVPNSVSALRLP